MNKLAWIGLLISGIGVGCWWTAGLKGKEDISLLGLGIIFIGALIMGAGFLKEHYENKGGFR